MEQATCITHKGEQTWKKHQPDTTSKPRSNPKKNVVLSIYERHQEVLTLPKNSVFCSNSLISRQCCYNRILQPMHALRSFISHVLYWPLLLWFNSNLKAILLQFWNSAWKWERNACDVKKRTGKFPISKRSFYCVYKKHFSPISSKSLTNCREINQKSLVAYTEEINSHLRHTQGQVRRTCP